MTTHDTMDEIFMGAGYKGGRDLRFPSARVSGYDVHMDPESSTGYYRSVVGKLSMTADHVTGAPFARTDLKPATFVVPGFGRVAPAITAEVLDAPGGSVVGALDAGTLVSLSEGVLTGPDGRSYLGISSPTEGYVPADQLDPEDSTGPRVWEIEPETLAFSPDGDGSVDALGVDVTWSEDADWTAKVEEPDGTNLDTWSGEGGTASFSWDGLGSGGSPLPDGSYKLTVRASDALGNDGSATTRTVTIDTHAPSLNLIGAAADASSPDAARLFTPNGDGQADALGIGYDVSQGSKVELTVRDASDAVVRRTWIGVSSGAGAVEWDGRADDGGTVADGHYEVSLRAKDAAGNTSATLKTHALVLKALKGLTRSASRFYPADGDKLARSTTFSFSLTKSATLDWTILRPDGSVLLTRYAGQAAAAGSYSWKWTGKDAAGAWVPEGTYSTVVSATTSAGTITQRLSVFVGAFRISPSTATLTRGKTVTVTIVTSEPLSNKPKLTVYQPGLSAYTVYTKKVSSSTYTVTFTVKPGGSAGTVKLKAYARDSGDRRQRSYLTLPLE
jgi:flagellar hook assembly protein FlgD